VGQEGNPLLSINGGRINATKFTYDGILAMDCPYKKCRC
jgi:hypothetical protein